MVILAGLRLALSFTSGWLRSALAWVMASTTRILLVCLACALLWGFWQRHEAAKFHRLADSTLAGWKADKSDWAEQVKTVTAQRDAALRKGKEIATHAQKTHEVRRADDARLRAYMDANRVRTPRAVPPAPSGEGASPAVPQGTATSTAILMDEEVVRVCKANGDYALDAHLWVRSLIDAGLAE